MFPFKIVSSWASKFSLAVIVLGISLPALLLAQRIEHATSQPAHPPLLEELQSRSDATGFSNLISRSTIEAETFRRQLVAGRSEANGARAVARACDSFRKSINVEFHAPNRLAFDLSRFQLDQQGIYDAIEGRRELPDPHQIYGIFQGKWYGIWDQDNVDHDWDRYTPLRTEQAFEIADGEPVKLLGYQYAWVGDGYGLNHIASSADRSKNFLLGYVVHIREQDLNREVSRRPHVGVIDGANRLIWITEGEVFFEEIIPGKSPSEDRYCITGFRYSIEENSLLAKQAFQAVYSRNPDDRTPWRGFDIKLKIQPPEPKSSPRS